MPFYILLFLTILSVACAIYAFAKSKTFEEQIDIDERELAVVRDLIETGQIESAEENAKGIVDPLLKRYALAEIKIAKQVENMIDDDEQETEDVNWLAAFVRAIKDGRKNRQTA